MRFVDCTEERHARAILDILNDAIVTSTALYDYAPRPLEAMTAHVIVAGIDKANAASIALHESLGFEACGVVRHAGFKFGRWLDLAFFELVLDGSPGEPRDG